MTGDERIRTLTDAAAARAVKRTDPAPRRSTIAALVAAGVLFVSLVGGGWYFWARINTLQAQADGNGSAARALAEQVERLGAEPVVEPPPGERGLTGATGAPGRDGRDGVDGSDGSDGLDGSDGRPGPPGANGTNGVDGQDGVTPPCMAEPTQCRGADGEDGRDGAQGPQGPPGPTCPEGYAPESRTYNPTPLTPGDEETWWVCVADEGNP